MDKLPTTSHTVNEVETVVSVCDRVAEIGLGLGGYPTFRIKIDGQSYASALSRIVDAWNGDAHTRSFAAARFDEKTETIRLLWLDGTVSRRLDLAPGLALGAIAPSDPSLGRKFDDEKPRWDLLPWRALGDVSAVLTYGARKYASDNWRYVEGWRWRYHSAALRHIAAWALGERLDPESRLPHLAHALCCLLFLADLDRPEGSPRE